MQRKNEKNCGNSEGVAQAFAERLGRRVRQLRISLELSQTELGQILGGFGMATISELERAKLKRMGLGMLARLLALCLERKISLEWLFAGIGAMEAVQPDLSDASREQLMRALAGQFADELLTRSRLRVAPAEAAEPLRAGDNVEPLPGPLQVVRLVEPGFRVVAVEQLPADEDWRGRFVPVLGRLAAGEGVDTVEAEQSPPGWADAFLLYKDAPAAAFALRVVGDSMLPDYRDGDMVVVDPGRPVKSGVCCAIYEHDGERAVRLKRVRISRGKTHLESLNPEYKTIDVPAKKVHAYRIVARLPRVVERTVG